MNWVEHPFYRAMVWTGRLVGYQLLFWVAFVAGFGVLLTFPALALLIKRLKEQCRGQQTPLRPWLIDNARQWFWPSQRIGGCWLAAILPLLGWRQLAVNAESGLLQSAGTTLLLLWIAVLPAWLAWRLERPTLASAVKATLAHPGQLLALALLLPASLVLAYGHPLLGAYTLLSLPLAIWLKVSRGIREEMVFEAR